MRGCLRRAARLRGRAGTLLPCHPANLYKSKTSSTTFLSFPSFAPDIAGLLMDKDDPSTLIPQVTVSEAKQLFETGVISGGMIPKVDCCIEAIEKGVKHVVMMDGRVPHSILMELLTDEGAGTMVLGD